MCSCIGYSTVADCDSAKVYNNLAVCRFVKSVSYLRPSREREREREREIG